jgi:hypothetical protein
MKGRCNVPKAPWRQRKCTLLGGKSPLILNLPIRRCWGQLSLLIRLCISLGPVMVGLSQEHLPGFLAPGYGLPTFAFELVPSSVGPRGLAPCRAHVPLWTHPDHNVLWQPDIAYGELSKQIGKYPKDSSETKLSQLKNLTGRSGELSLPDPRRVHVTSLPLSFSV